MLQLRNKLSADHISSGQRNWWKIMFGIRFPEFLLMAVVFLVVASVTIGVIYVAVRLALRHERKNSN